MRKEYKKYKCIIKITIDRFVIQEGKIYEINNKTNTLKLTDNVGFTLSNRELQCFEKLR